MEIRTAGSSCRRPQLLFDQIYIFSHSIGPSVFKPFRRQPVDSRNEVAINSTRNTIYSLKVFYVLTLSKSILFICFWIDLVRVLATTGNNVCGRRLYACINTRKIKGPRFQRNFVIARDQKKWFTWHVSFQSSPKINRMLITRAICIQWKFTTPDHRSFAN